MSDLDRRNFVGLIGIGSLGTLVASAAGAQGTASGKAGHLAVSPPAAAPAGLVGKSATIVQETGITIGDMKQIRDIITSTLPAGELQNLSDLLTAARDGLKAGKDDPPELTQFQQKLEPYLQGMAEQVLELTGGRAAVRQKMEEIMSDPDRDPVDWWSLVHFLSGAALGALCFSFKWTLIILILWEVIEPWIWEGWNESPINIVMDVIIGMLGWMTAQIIKEILQQVFDEKGQLPADLALATGKA